MSSIARLTRNRLLAVLSLVILCAALLLPGIGESTIARQQELRVVLASRDMAEGGSWLIPHFMGEERLRKPPLMYWIVATAFKTAGTTESATVARLPSAIAGTALVIATFLFGGRMIGRRAAFVGAIVLATSIGFTRHARLSETDIPQTLFCSLAIFAAYFALTGKHPMRTWILTGIAAGIGFMIKGPASIAMPLAAIATFQMLAKFRAKISWPGAIAALAIFVAIATPWYIAVAMQTSANSQSQAGNEIARLLSESAHKGPVAYYLWTLPARMGIWALALPVAIFASWKKLRHHRGPRFLLGWFASSFVILSALSSKQSHYALLLFAPSALLTGWLIARAGKIPMIGKNGRDDFQSLGKTAPGFYPRFARGYLVALCALVALAGIAVVAARFVAFQQPVPIAIESIGPIPIICACIGIAGLIVRRKLHAMLLAIAATIALITGTYALRVEPIFDGMSVLPDLVLPRRDLIRQAPRFFVTGPHASIVTWYAHRDVIVSTNSVAETLKIAGPGDVVLATDRSNESLNIAKLPARPEIGQKRRDVSVILYRKPDGTESP